MPSNKNRASYKIVWKELQIENIFPSCKYYMLSSKILKF